MATLRNGCTATPDVWAELYWIEDHNVVGAGGSLAVRKRRADGLWYTTHGYMHEARVLYGPYPSKEAVEMLLMMDALEF